MRLALSPQSVSRFPEWMRRQMAAKKKLVFKVYNWRMKDADVGRNIHIVDLDRY